MMQILDSGLNSAEFNMRNDERLLEGLEPGGDPILHFYEWDGPAATYGYFIDPSKHLDLSKVRSRRIDLARRPTGGGIVFHIWDLAFSFLMPASHPKFSLTTLANYRFVNQAVLEVMQGLLKLCSPVDLLPPEESCGHHAAEECSHFCMAKPTVYDVVYEGRKIAGAAQRRRKNGYLHQGTISLAMPQVELLKDVLLSEQDVLAAMMAYSFAPLGRDCGGREIGAMRREIRERLAENLRAKL